MKRVQFGFVAHKNSTQLSRGYLVYQMSRHKRPRVHAYVNIQIVEVQPFQSFVQRSQRTYFINAANRAATA